MYVPLNHLYPDQATYTVVNSCLSEFGVLGNTPKIYNQSHHINAFTFPSITVTDKMVGFSLYLTLAQWQLHEMFLSTGAQQNSVVSAKWIVDGSY